MIQQGFTLHQVVNIPHLNQGGVVVGIGPDNGDMTIYTIDFDRGNTHKFPANQLQAQGA